MPVNFDFSFFEFTNHAPLARQSRLYGDGVDGRIRSALDLPTGLGNNPVIAIWFTAAATGARPPRRLTSLGPDGYRNIRLWRTY